LFADANTTVDVPCSARTMAYSSDSRAPRNCQVCSRLSCSKPSATPSARAAALRFRSCLRFLEERAGDSGCYTRVFKHAPPPTTPWPAYPRPRWSGTIQAVP
jgi:hypothetical protein